MLLIHQIPPEPAYFRVKVRRRLQRMGAVLLKNSVYVLPQGEETLEDFEWLRQEIEREGGEATICMASFADEVTDMKLVEEFRSARTAEYEAVRVEAKQLRAELEGKMMDDKGRASLNRRAGKLRRRLAEISSLDFFGASGRTSAERAISALESRKTRDAAGGAGAEGEADAERPLGRIWVTRVGAKVDRISSAWLIRRFLDPAARFKFVPASGYEPEAGELRFDMFEGEYTHVGEDCTFETLLASFGLDDPALAAIGEIIHDIDCKDDKFGRAEAAGVASMIDGITRTYAEDEARLDRGRPLFDDLYEHFRSSAT